MKQVVNKATGLAPSQFENAPNQTISNHTKRMLVFRAVALVISELEFFDEEFGMSAMVSNDSNNTVLCMLHPFHNPLAFYKEPKNGSVTDSHGNAWNWKTKLDITGKMALTLVIELPKVVQFDCRKKSN